GRPPAAAVAMAAVALVTGVAAGQGPTTAVLGVLASFGYLLAATVVTLAGVELTWPLGAVAIVVGGVAGFAVAAVSAAVRSRGTTGALRPPRGAVVVAMARSLRTFDAAARDGARRAVPLAVGMHLFQSTGSRDALWVLVAAFAVLLPTGKVPLDVAALRAVATMAAVVVVGVVESFVGGAALLALAAVLLLGGLVYAGRYPLAGTVAMTVAVIVFAAAPDGRLDDWAAHRLVDTLIGCALALAALALLWPGDPDAAPGAPFTTADGDPTGPDRPLTG
ncbi:MAG: FUSC family protein, partial [Actinomycetota bacterium]|nr:FUSC family protein [Actinomycetota bacterium]